MEKLNILISIVFILTLGLVSASSVTISSPTTSAVLGNNTLLNLTVTGLTGVNRLNCTWYLASASTANSSQNYLTISHNYTSLIDAFPNSSQIYYNFSYRNFEDASNYILTAACDNGTTSVTTNGTKSSLIYDYTVPTAPSSLSPSTNTVDSDGSVSFSATMTDADTTACTIRFNGINPGSVSYTGTYATTSCSYSLSSIPEQTYNWVVRASDGRNTTDSSVNVFKIDTTKSSPKELVLIKLREEGKIQKTGIGAFSIVGNMWENGILGIPTWMVLAFIGIGVVIYIYVKRK